VAAKRCPRDTPQRNDTTINDDPVYLPNDQEQTASMSCTVDVHSVDSSYDDYTHHDLAHDVAINRHEISLLIYSPIHNNEKESWSRFVKGTHDIEKDRR
jgi:hypothetical protein